jgi:hypothetical protein
MMLDENNIIRLNAGAEFFKWLVFTEEIMLH